MHCGLWYMDHASWITRATFFEIAVYPMFVVVILFLFRPHRLREVKRKLILVACLAYFLDTTYLLVLQALGISHSRLSTLQKSPLYVMFFYGCVLASLSSNESLPSSGTDTKRTDGFVLQITVPCPSLTILAIAVKCIIYPLYKKQSTESKLRLVIAIFAPLIGVLYLKWSREFLFSP